MFFLLNEIENEMSDLLEGFRFFIHEDELSNWACF